MSELGYPQELRYPQALMGCGNKFMKKLPLYYGRPMVYHDTGFDYNQYRQIRQPWLMKGHVIWFHKDLIGMMWCIVGFSHHPIFRLYKEDYFYNRLPISYGYQVGDKVIRVTDGRVSEITHINWNAQELFCRTPDILPTGSLSYDLFRPFESDRTCEFDPMEHGYWEGIFKI